MSVARCGQRRFEPELGFATQRAPPLSLGRASDWRWRRRATGCWRLAGHSRVRVGANGAGAGETRTGAARQLQALARTHTRRLFIWSVGAPDAARRRDLCATKLTAAQVGPSCGCLLAARLEQSHSSSRRQCEPPIGLAPDVSILHASSRTFRWLPGQRQHRLGRTLHTQKQRQPAGMGLDFLRTIAVNGSRWPRAFVSPKLHHHFFSARGPEAGAARVATRDC